MNKKALETIQNQDTVIVLNSADIEALKKKALLNERKRIRINLHHGMDSQVHEMIIVHCRNNYVRPHKHSIKAESFHIIEGDLSVIMFDDAGKVIRVIEMGPLSSGKHFCYRTIANQWHSVIPRSEIVVFHETTDGPFRPEGTIQAPWAPDDSDQDKGNLYFKNLGLIE